MTTTGPDIEALLGRLAEQPAPDPRPLFVHRLEADLRSLAAGETLGPEPARPAGARPRPLRAWITAAAAAVAIAVGATVVHDAGTTPPRRTQVGSHGEPGTVPAPPPTTTPVTAEPTTTTGPRPGAPTTSTTSVSAGPVTTPVTVPPGDRPTSPATADPAAGTGSTTGTTVTVTTAGPVGAAPATTTSTAAIPTTAPTTAPPEVTTSTTVATPALSCTTAISSNVCTWNRTNAAGFAGYQLRRATMDGPWTTVFKSTSASTTTYTDSGIPNGMTLRYQLDVLDSNGTVLATSAVSTVTCCSPAK